MKTSFKKSLAVFMAALMLLSAVGVSAIAAQYTVTLKAGNYGKETDLVITLGPVDRNKQVELPDVTYTRDGYVQNGWSNYAEGSSKNYNLGAKYRVTGNKTLYPSWEVAKNAITYKPGADGIGSDVRVEVEINEVVTLEGALFTRDGYVQVGWTTTDGGDLVYRLGQESPAMTESLTLYPVWEKAVFAAQVDVNEINLGCACLNYEAPEAKTFTITNIGNSTLQYTLPTSANYVIAIVSGNLKLAAGESLTISVQPVTGLGISSYAEELVVVCDKTDANVAVSVNFAVTDHTFGKYVSNNDATYSADGTKTAVCLNGCGASHTITDVGSMKVYSADNNDAAGLASEYIHHRTVRFTAFGSGCDNTEVVVGTKRYLPVSWYVNEEYNGTFEDGDFDVVFTHTVFGKYTLKINYIEQVYTCDNEAEPTMVCFDCGEIVDGDTCPTCGNPSEAYPCEFCGQTNCGNALLAPEDHVCSWQATGEADEKTFEYTVGTTAEEEQEIVMPNTILTLIFGLFSKLLELLGIGNLIG